MCGSGTLAWSFFTTPISWEQSDTHCQAQALVISNTSRCRSPFRLYSQLTSQKQVIKREAQSLLSCGAMPSSLA